jgi:DNA polymerase IV (archaeal DinB-like DNA polymerase)
MRLIAHLDMDAFYAAVEERDHPELRGRPIVTGADPKAGQGRGVVTTANYAARKYGIRSALPISRAWRLAEAARRRGEPATVFLQGDHAHYQAVSARIMAIVVLGADAFEQASIDEAYLDLSSRGEWGAAEAHLRAVKAEIRAREGLTCSVGLGPNKLVAKIASDMQKPDGLTVVPTEAVQGFLDPLAIRVLPGIGPKTEAMLHERGIRTIADLGRVEGSKLTAWFGKWGEDLSRKARGLSDDPVSNDGERKSVGEQETFERDTLNRTFVTERARTLANTVFRRSQADGVAGFRTVTVTVRLANFVTMSRSHTVKGSMTTEAELTRTALELLDPFFDARENPRRRLIRLIGVRVEKLVREAGSSTTQVGLALDVGP